MADEKKRNGSQGMNHDERFNQICNPVLTRIDLKLGEIHKAIFVGNGTPAITTRLAKGDEKLKQHDKYFTALFWIAGAISTPLIVAGVVAGVKILLRQQ